MPQLGCKPDGFFVGVRVTSAYIQKSEKREREGEGEKKKRVAYLLNAL